MFFDFQANRIQQEQESTLIDLIESFKQFRAPAVFGNQLLSQPGPE